VIDWPHVLADAVWICGAALTLATFSYASWLASVRDERCGTDWVKPRCNCYYMAQQCWFVSDWG
jgi:hypothetical protein